MVTIQIAYEVPAATVAKIKEHITQAATHDINWSGAEFKIERDDFTCIDDDSAKAVILMHEINDIIRCE